MIVIIIIIISIIMQDDIRREIWRSQLAANRNICKMLLFTNEIIS